MKTRRGFSLLVLACVLLSANWTDSDGRTARVIMPGVLSRDSSNSCDCLIAPGTLPIPYRLDNLGGFALGDTVVVVADSLDVCDCGDRSIPCLPGGTVYSWRNFDFGCGTLVLDAEYDCSSLVTDGYGWIAVDPAGFPDGSRLTLVGTLEFECLLPWPCAAPLCMREQTLTPCATPTQRITWGGFRGVYR